MSVEMINLVRLRYALEAELATIDATLGAARGFHHQEEAARSRKAVVQEDLRDVRQRLREIVPTPAQ